MMESIRDALPGASIEYIADTLEHIASHRDEIETLLSDYYVVYENIEEESGPVKVYGLRANPGTRQPFLEIPKNSIMKKKHRYIIYVLANSEDTFRQAKELYEDKHWARVIFIPTTYYLESAMYLNILPRLKHEWEFSDLVGCIAWSAHTKQPRIFELDALCDEAMKGNSDVVSFLYRGDPMIETAEHWHPGFTELWKKTLKTFGWNEDVILNPRVPSFYANYWATTPQLMNGYCEFALQAAHRLDTQTELRELLWRDASYTRRGSDIAKISPSECQRIWGVPYYPFHAFLFERLPCFWLVLFSRKIAGIR